MDYNSQKKELKLTETLYSSRTYFIDYLRAFLVCLVVLDHAMHAYCEHFAKYWFLPDFDRSIFFDVLHMHNDSFMMPALFFLSGLFILPSLQRRGYLSFIKERLMRLGIPFVIGVIFICPLLSYPKYLINENPLMEYREYLTTVYFFEGLHSGPFWFLYYLALLTTIAVILYALFPAFYRGLGTFCGGLLRNPIKGILLITGIGALIMGLSDLMWGAPWWIGFGKLFYIRGSRFIWKAVLFFLGIGFSQCDILKNEAFWQKLDQTWQQWAIIAVGAGTLYISYSLVNYDMGAYNNDVRYFFRAGGEWSDVASVFYDSAPPILIRTSLLTLFMLSQMIAYLAIFHRFAHLKYAAWQSLAASSYGIYIIHEPFVVWCHWFFNGTDMPILLKFVIAGLGSLFLSWFIVQRGLLKNSIFKRIL